MTVETAGRISRSEIAELLSLEDPVEREKLRAHAEEVMRAKVGPEVYYRGLIEFSNACRLDCLYCGIRRSNFRVRRYTLSEDEIVAAACACADLGYGSVTLQSGERGDDRFVDFVCRAIERIKESTRSTLLPVGLGITLCVGEQSQRAYRRLFAAGAHRYLLRIETSNPALYARIHPERQKFETRIACLETLAQIGFQVGTGVMIGLPGQSVEDLADDILFFRKIDADMIGMGPFLPHPDTPLGAGTRSLAPTRGSSCAFPST